VNIGTNWIILAHNGDQLQALENKLMNFLSSIKGSSPSSQKPITKLYSECNPTYIFATHSFKINFNIIISFTLTFPIVSCQVVLQQNLCILNNSSKCGHRHGLAKQLCLFIEDVQATVCTSLDERRKSVSALN
jgi:hypothetical protein